MLTSSGYSSDAFEKAGVNGQLAVDDSPSRIKHRHSQSGGLAEHAEEQASEGTDIRTTVNRPVETA